MNEKVDDRCPHPLAAASQVALDDRGTVALEQAHPRDLHVLVGIDPLDLSRAGVRGLDLDTTAIHPQGRKHPPAETLVAATSSQVVREGNSDLKQQEGGDPGVASSVHGVPHAPLVSQMACHCGHLFGGAVWR